MEYFNFDEAARQNGDTFRTAEAEDLGRRTPIPVDLRHIIVPTACPSIQPESEVKQASGLDGAYPMHRVKDPCHLCRCMGLDCVVAQRGVMQNACTCCIALYRECSFTRALTQGGQSDGPRLLPESGGEPGRRNRSPKPESVNRNNYIGDLSQQQPRKPGVRFSLKAVKVLKSWLLEHASHPYPTDVEKDELKSKTGLNRNQISSWLANARRRGKVRLHPRSSPPHSGAVTIPGKRLPPGVDISELDPLERWKHSPPENEAASARDIIQAMATSSFPSHVEVDTRNPKTKSRNTESSNEDSFSNKMTAQSVSSYSVDTNMSSLSDMSFASAFSHRSRGSWNSTETRERRRRRHKSAAAPNPFQKSRVARIFQCTFCTDSFPTKYDWQRHEKSLHLALDKWTCAPHGGIVTSANGRDACAFCQHLNPDEEHLEMHNFSTCQEKSVQERTFYRKDHLNQHLRLMHGVKLAPWMDTWKSATTKITSRCGFCSATFNTWKERVDHLAAHFKAGVEISQWQGDWGFEPHIEKCVENSMPPYLIGQERNTLDPWVASKGFNIPKYGRNLNKEHKVALSEVSGASSLGITFRTDASSFRRLEKELSAYISHLLKEGVVPTDKLIQSKARLIIYGSDDTWNQTCADNNTWLKVLKQNNGLHDTHDTENVQLEDLGMQPPFAMDGGLRQAPVDSTTAPQALSGGTLSPPSGLVSTNTSIPESVAGSTRNSFEFSLKCGNGGGGSSLRDFDYSTGGLSPNDLQLSLSAPITGTTTVTSIPHGESDPLLEMGFDAEFLHQLNEEFDFEGLNYIENAGAGTFSLTSNYDSNNFDNVSTPDSTPVTPLSGMVIPSPEETFGSVSSSGQVESIHIPGSFDSMFIFQHGSEGYERGLN